MKKLITAFCLIAATGFATLSPTYEPAQYDANGSTTAFPVTWSFFDTSDVIVYVTDSDGDTTILTEGSGAGKFTVTAPNNDYSDGATITTGTTYPSGTSITIERSVAYGQDLDIVGDFIPGDPLETALDKIAAQNQQVKEEIGRTLTIPVTDPTGLTNEFPSAESRAGKIASFDSSGNVTVIDPVDSGTISVDDVTIEQDGTTLQIVDGGVDTTQVNDKAITPAKLSSVTGSDTNIITGTKGNNGQLVGWDASGDAVDSGYDVTNNDSLGTSDTTLATQGNIKSYIDGDGLIQIVNFETGEKAYTNSAVIPADDTIPQSDEGFEVMTLSITPEYADSKLKIDVQACFDAGGSSKVCALFKNSETNAIACSYNYNNSNFYTTHTLSKIIDSGSTEQTFKVRVGSNSGAVTFNGNNNDIALYGGTLNSYITITEIR